MRPIALVLALTLAACRADNKDVFTADDSGGGEGSGEGGGVEGGGEGGGSTDPFDSDDDGDGYAENDGDCDDGDPGIYPGAADGCDDQDDDCDGEVDEDAADDDDTEPNDSRAYDMGEVGSGEVLSVSALLHNDDDVDNFSFSFDDSYWPGFTLQVVLSEIPSGAVYRMTIEHTDTGEEVYAEYGSDDLTFSLEDTWFYEDGGTYLVTIDALSGADCSRYYLLSVSLD